MSTAMQQAHRLKVQLGPHGFEAEGTEEVVNAQYSLFLKAIETAGAIQDKKTEVPSDGNSKSRQESGGSIEDATWGRFFLREGDSDVSLKVLPNTDSPNPDAIVLLLYGYLELCNQDTVASAPLLAMAKKSGLRIDRIDRNIPTSYSRYINKGGSRRGSRYSLNNQGKAYAQQLLETEAER